MARLNIKPEYKEFVNKLDIGNGKYGIRTVFEDFIILSTIAIKNRYDYNQEDEDVYLKIINKYEKKEQKIFAELLAMYVALTIEQKEDIQDILGEIYQGIGVASKSLNQFFTPIHISKFMGATINCEEQLKNKDFITVYDPCCGSGSLILGYVDANRHKIKDFSKKVIFFARDLDFKCVCMTFLQFTANQIPAQIMLGNSLAEETRKVLYTPEFVNENWFEKLNDRRKAA